MRSFVRNCFIKSRGEVLFTSTDDLVAASLQGYAVIPIEEYTALLSPQEEARFLQGFPPPLLLPKSGKTS